MKYKFKIHPLMIFTMLPPYLFFLAIPLVKVILKFLISRETHGLFLWESIALIGLLLMGIAEFKRYSVKIDEEKIKIEWGFIFRRSASVYISNISSAEETVSIIDRVFGAVTYKINTEAGFPKRVDFKFKLYKEESKRLSKLLYGEKPKEMVKFSLLRTAAATSSVITGIIISVPAIRRIGDLLGITLEEMLFDRINDAANKIQFYFPPVVNAITIVVMAAYFIAFCYSFLKYARFRIGFDEQKIEVLSGFITRKKTYFMKSAVNNIKIEQRPLMRLLKLYSLGVSVAGFDNSRKEAAAVVPCGKKKQIEKYSHEIFGFKQAKSQGIRPEHSLAMRNRFLFKPLAYSGIIIGIAVAAVMIFSYFDRLMLFFMSVGLLATLYYADLCIYNYNNSLLKVEDNIVEAKGIKGFSTKEIRCKNVKVGEIKLIRYPWDKRHNTCKVKITVHSESADKIRLLHLDYNAVKKTLFEAFD